MKITLTRKPHPETATGGNRQTVTPRKDARFVPATLGNPRPSAMPTAMWKNRKGDGKAK